MVMMYQTRLNAEFRPSRLELRMTGGGQKRFFFSVSPLTPPPLSPPTASALRPGTVGIALFAHAAGGILTLPPLPLRR